MTLQDTFLLLVFMTSVGGMTDALMCYIGGSSVSDGPFQTRSCWPETFVDLESEFMTDMGFNPQYGGKECDAVQSRCVSATFQHNNKIDTVGLGCIPLSYDAVYIRSALISLELTNIFFNTYRVQTVSECDHDYCNSCISSHPAPSSDSSSGNSLWDFIVSPEGVVSIVAVLLSCVLCCCWVGMCMLFRRCVTPCGFSTQLRRMREDRNELVREPARVPVPPMYQPNDPNAPTLYEDEIPLPDLPPAYTDEKEDGDDTDGGDDDTNNGDIDGVDIDAGRPLLSVVEVSASNATSSPARPTITTRLTAPIPSSINTVTMHNNNDTDELDDELLVLSSDTDSLLLSAHE
eukprot:m.67660 g.67660  ORF g.67660 m.67660 type:complete len:347 (+) comp23855_c0_seq1:160-1200(+)